ncbi:DUF305 domain-containing protein [Actinomadura rupiterrae]|uniref:DUF305 domain-containing protein n=1 Tax=Actinomadura rupiterrae TaxID=559627 RepID=UPI0020A44E83|nr:DUF305 domain-containing protein [Actinomadura rupiterrae]MCP2340850.1 uncharacterized protein (DUF305 family) [Actinomadura rupiterrae]
MTAAGTEAEAPPVAPRGRRTAVLLVVAVVAVAAVLYGWTQRSGRPAAEGPEAGFARDMSVHHAQAVQMSFTVRDRTQDKAVRLLAYDIINTQQAQIGMMTAWLDGWDLPKTDPAGPMRWMGHGGHGAGTGTGAGAGAGASVPADGAMPGMATPAQLAGLEKASGRPAETLFLRLMIAHHRGGVAMAEAVLGRTGNAQVKRLARTMVEGQRAEIDLMERMLTERGSPAV